MAGTGPRTNHRTGAADEADGEIVPAARPGLEHSDGALNRCRREIVVIVHQHMVTDSQGIPFHAQHQGLQFGIKRTRHGSQIHQSLTEGASV